MVKVFDLDGTLLDSNGVWRWVDGTFVGQFGLSLTDEYNEYVSHAIFPDAARFTKAYYGLSISEEAIMDSWYQLAYNAYARDLELKPNTLTYLKHCKVQGDRMVLYTSSQPALCKAALEHHQITAYFEELFFAQELNLEKKYPASFSRLSQILGEAPEHCLLLDDSPLACASAKSAGWRVIGVEDPFFAHRRTELISLCDRTIQDFSELLS